MRDPLRPHKQAAPARCLLHHLTHPLGSRGGKQERGGWACAGARPSEAGRSLVPRLGRVHAFTGGAQLRSVRGDNLGHPEQVGGLGRSRVGGGSAWARAGLD